MPETKTCPVCNIPLELKTEGYAMGSSLSRNRMHADLYVCPKCRGIHMYESKSDNMVKCPVCGNMHHEGEKCLYCELNKIPGANAAS